MLIELTDNVYDMPQRLKEYDPTLKLFFNSDTQQFEVWSYRPEGERFSKRYINSAPEADERLLKDIRARDSFRHADPVREWMKEIYAEEKYQDEQKEKRQDESRRFVTDIMETSTKLGVF